MVLIFPSSAPRTPSVQHYHDEGDFTVIRHLSLTDAPLELPENSYTGIHLAQPGSCFVSPTPYLNCEKKILKKLEKEDPSESHTIAARQVNLQSAGTFKYKYGSVDVRKIPLLRSCKFLCVDGAGGSKLKMSLDDKHLSPATTEIPLGSNFGQNYLATAFGLPISHKLTLFRKADAAEMEASTTASLSLTFLLPNGVSLSKIEVIALCMAHEIADEVMNCTGNAKRIQYISERVCADPTPYLNEGSHLIQAMELVKKELKLRKKRFKNSQLSSACQLVDRECGRIIRSLSNAGVNSNRLFPLPSFTQLTDSAHFHFSHQHGVKDKRYNLVV